MTSQELLNAIALYRVSRGEKLDFTGGKHPPAEVVQHLDTYVINGDIADDFTRAIVNDSFATAVLIAYADITNTQRIDGLPAIAGFVTKHLPPQSWGSPAAVERWTEAHRRKFNHA